jgi:uncharacterized membrane protein YkvA (DUF1232 family)
MQEYSKHYNDTAFRNKISRSAALAGRRTVETALVLYYCLRDPETPTKARAAIIGALGYWILPFDAIPDFIPAVGFTDDLAAMVAVVSMLFAYVKPEHRARARQKVDELFSGKEKGK